MVMPTDRAAYPPQPVEVAGFKQYLAEQIEHLRGVNNLLVQVIQEEAQTHGLVETLGLDEPTTLVVDFVAWRKEHNR